jgi:hypothetical protein
MGYPIVLTCDRIMAGNDHVSMFFGFSACLPQGTMPADTARLSKYPFALITDNFVHFTTPVYYRICQRLKEKDESAHSN